MMKEKLSMCATLSFLVLVIAGCTIQNSEPTPTSWPTSAVNPWGTLPWPIEQGVDRVMELYETNGDCEISSCWWGITPGITSYMEAYQILSPLGVISVEWFSKSDPWRIQYDFSAYNQYIPKEVDPENRIGASLVELGNRIVEVISSSSGSIKQTAVHPLAVLLTDFGPPEIWVETMPHFSFTSPTNPSYYGLILFYPEKGYLSVTGVEEFDGDTIIICPQHSPYPYDDIQIVLWSKENKITFEEGATGIQKDFFSFDMSKWNRLDNLSSNMSEQEFYDIYRDPNATECIKITPQQ